MKKKIIGICMMAAIALAAGWNINQSKNDAALSDLALSNVEALASNENYNGYCTMHTPCFDNYGNPTGKHTASSYHGPNCSGSYHNHACSSCNRV